VGRALKDWRGPKPYIFTKCGLRGNAKGEVQRVLSADSIRGKVEDSLSRLSADVIDLYQIHWPPDPDSSALEVRILHTRQSEAGGQGALNWGVQFRCPTAPSRPGHRNGNFSAASVFSCTPRGRRRGSTLLSKRRNWSHSLFPNGFRSSERRHDPRACNRAPQGRPA
jgi:Aldo/keto reductase family